MEELIDRLEKESGKLGNSGELSSVRICGLHTRTTRVLPFSSLQPVIMNIVCLSFSIHPLTRSKACIFAAQAQAIRAARERLGIQNTHIVEDVYRYWISKRVRLRKPLLRRLWPPTAPTDTNPHNVFRPRDKGRYNTRRQKKNDPESLLKMQQLRDDFKKVQDIVGVVRRRERLKLEAVRLRVDAFEQVCCVHCAVNAACVLSASRVDAASSLSYRITCLHCYVLTACAAHRVAQELYDLTNTSGKPRVPEYLARVRSIRMLNTTL